MDSLLSDLERALHQVNKELANLSDYDDSDLTDALKSHKEGLLEKQEQLDSLIKMVREPMIGHDEGVKELREEASPEDEALYAAWTNRHQGRKAHSQINVSLDRKVCEPEPIAAKATCVKEKIVERRPDQASILAKDQMAGQRIMFSDLDGLKGIPHPEKETLPGIYPPGV